MYIRTQLWKAGILVIFYATISASEKDDVIHVRGLLESVAQLPCDTRPPSLENPTILVVWTKEPSANPIYTYDLRTKNGRQEGRGDHWYDSFNLGGRGFFKRYSNGSSYLSIESLQDRDGGKYRCRVDFDKAPAKITKIFLHTIALPDPPRILTPDGRKMEVVNFYEGSHLSLVCKVFGGRPKPEIQWFVNNRQVEGGPTELKELDVISTFDFGTLSRQDVDTNVTCSASNNNLTNPVQTTLPINLLLLPQQVQIQSTRESLSAGVRTPIRCISWGSRPLARISWWLGGHPLPVNFTEVTRTDDRDNLTESTLYFTPSRNDTGQLLKCRSENPSIAVSEIEDTWSLDINYKPLVSITLGSTLNSERIKEGDDVYFECLVVSKPPVFKVSWKFNGEELRQNVREGTIMGNQSLVLQELGKGSSGAYTCTATNTEGTGESIPQKLDVKYKPVCEGERSKVFGVARGEVLSINCTVDGNPTSGLKFHWSFNNTSESADIQESRFSSNGAVSNLIYSPHHELDYGTILCWAENQLGVQDEPCSFHIIPAGFDGGLDQKFQLEIVQSEGDGMTLINQSSTLPQFSLGKVDTGKTALKGMSEKILLPLFKNDASLENGPITRAAKNTDLTKDESRREGKNGQDSLINIILGVSAALAFVILIIIITMTVKCGRTTNSWPARDGSGTNSPDFLVNTDTITIGDGDFVAPGRSIYSSRTTITSPSLTSSNSRTLSLPNRGSAGVLTLHSLPPPPPPVPKRHGSLLVDDLTCTELPPPPEWASGPPLPPPDSFFTLPRKEPSSKPSGQRSVTFSSRSPQHRTNLDRKKSNSSHVESIV